MGTRLRLKQAPQSVPRPDKAVRPPVIHHAVQVAQRLRTTWIVEICYLCLVTNTPLCELKAERHSRALLVYLALECDNKVCALKLF